MQEVLKRIELNRSGYHIMTWEELKSIVTKQKKSYGHLANIELKDGRLFCRNKSTGSLHPWPDGKQFLPVSKSHFVALNELLR